MAGYHLTDAEFIAEWHKSPSAVEMAKKVGVNIRNLLKRRRAIESRNNIVLEAKGGKQDKLQYQNIKISRAEETPHNARREIQMEKGRVVVFSDAHFWPDDYTTAYKALLMIIKEFRPKVVIANGDVFDGSQASRHPRIGWSNTPTIKEELEACKEFMGNIEKAAIGA
jgi:hypothetical protein